MQYYDLIQKEDGGDKLTFPSEVVFEDDVTINGTLQGRTYKYEFSEIDISATAATVVGAIFPVAGKILKAYAIVTEAIADTAITTATYSIGTANADGSTGADVDAIVDATPVVRKASLGTVYELPFVSTDVAAGDVITATHVAQEIAGKLKLVVEYQLTG